MSMFNLSERFGTRTQIPASIEPTQPRASSKRENFASVARALAATQQRITNLETENRKLTVENVKLNERIKYELEPMAEFFSRHWASPDEAMAWERSEVLRIQREEAIMTGDEAQFATIPYELKEKDPLEEGQNTE